MNAERSSSVEHRVRNGAKLCTGTSKRTGKPCGAIAVSGREVCHFHGGQTPVGPAHYKWTTGEHSRYLPVIPQRLRQHFQRALEDESWASMRNEIALIDSRLTELVAQLDSGESGALWSQLHKRWADVIDAKRDRDPTKYTEAVDAVGAAITLGADEHARWAELRAAIDQRLRLAESERRRAVELQEIYTAEQAATMFGAIAEALKKHVTDRGMLAAVSAELAKLRMARKAERTAVVVEDAEEEKQG